MYLLRYSTPASTYLLLGLKASSLGHSSRLVVLSVIYFSLKQEKLAEVPVQLLPVYLSYYNIWLLLI